jgi:integrase
MKKNNLGVAQVIDFPKAKKISPAARKAGLNRNRDGSVRKINGYVYVDFYYLDERVRENSGLTWNDQNAKQVREQLDKIIVAIKSGTFRFAEVFPNSNKRDYFSEKERNLFGLKKTPEQVYCKEYFGAWYDLLKSSGRVTGRTLLGYKSHMNLYLIPFFGEKVFADLNTSTFSKFIAWARQKNYQGREVGNETLNKCFALLKMICKDVAIEYRWNINFDPFFGFKKLPEGDAYEQIIPFSLEEQRRLITALPESWKPFFRFAFCSGLRQGEQIGIKPADIDWKKQILHIRRAITCDETGKIVEGRTKNRYSRRSIKLLPVMIEALNAQKKIYDQHNGEYFFCSSEGRQVHRGNLHNRVWVPALERAGIVRREMKQTRHTFATVALSCGESPLWISKVLGHRDTNMLIRVYGKYIENAMGTTDGVSLNNIFNANLVG